MTNLDDIALTISKQRRRRRMTQFDLAAEAKVSRALLAKLETGRLPEIGVKKLGRILNAIGLDLRITDLNRKRPTLEDLRAEDESEQE